MLVSFLISLIAVDPEGARARARPGSCAITLFPFVSRSWHWHDSGNSIMSTSTLPNCAKCPLQVIANYCKEGLWQGRDAN